ncbi:MAG: Type 1 glutamine amidotransferase-like domain-containing protein, partial [Oscillospiraceae bacterium]
MIFLTSNGITSPPLREQFFLAKEKYGDKTAFVPTAISSKNEKAEYLGEMLQELSCLGCKAEVFELEERDPLELLDFDIVYLSGGNVFFLMDVLHKLNCKAVFERLVREKLVVGVSAGSLVLQDNLELIRELVPRMNRHV